MRGRVRRLTALIAALAIFAQHPLGSEAFDIPAEVREAAEKAGERYGICPELLEAIAYEESRFTSDVVSKNGKYIGLMQVNPTIHQERVERLGADLKDPDGAMEVAADYLTELFQKYEDVGAVLIAYGGSEARIEAYEASGSLPGYVAKVLERAEMYERAHGK